jgi:hypothetical protein
MLPADKHPITRRDLLRGAATGIAALAIRGDLKAAQLPSRPPNIVFVLADAKGVRFLQAYANSAVCTAER